MATEIKCVLTLDELEPEMILAKDVYTPEGQVLLRAGTVLNQRYIQKMQQFDVRVVWIKKVIPEDLSPEECELLQQEEEARRAYIEAVNVVEQVMNDVRMGEALDMPTMREAVSNLCAVLLTNEHLLKHVDELHLYDDYTFAHSVQVCVFTIIIGKALGYEGSKLEDVGTGGLLHDIGKTRLPIELLNLPRKYTPEEFELVKNHARWGEEILNQSGDVPEIVVRMAGEHHERYNGTGYYKGLKEDEIHPFSQITALADVYDAMTTTRAYRPAMLPQQAIEFLLTSCGTFFNPEICDLFIKHVAIFPVGYIVQLTNGLLAKILEVDEKMPSRPVVGVMEAEKSFKITEVLDLRRRNDILITRLVPQSEILKLKKGVKISSS
ncbi:MAG: HD domain-containing protein [Firmicutes bacterium]|nr:HD domain-containing protein [Bacillota bacterium]